VLGLTLSELSILLLPLDIANRAACADAIVLTACNFALPMLELWTAVYMMMLILIIFVVPFTLFYYEQDHDMTVRGKLISSSWWVAGTFVILGLILGLSYGFAGFVDLPVTTLTSGIAPFGASASVLGASAEACVKTGTFPASSTTGYACDASSGVPTETWSVRTSFPIYVVALTSVISWILFIAFGGVGVSALPVDLVKAFLGRPKTVIPKSEYIKIAGKIAEHTQAVIAEAREVQREERGTGRTRKTRRALAKIDKKLTQLEEDELTLQKIFPQGEDREASWMMTVSGYYAKLVLGILSGIVSLMWLLHIALYVFPSPPVTPFLNDFFVALDDAWGLFGTAAFALFCCYLIMCVIKGNIKVGFRFLLFAVYPMRLNGTLMSSFLFNVGLIMLSSISVIQFCARAFDGYAAETSVSKIFGDELNHLRGIGALFEENVFMYIFFAFAGLAAIVLAHTEVKEGRQPKRAIESLYK
jgi:LMBR1 domain-containing protein 1